MLEDATVLPNSHTFQIVFSEWVFSLLKYKWKSKRQKINKISKDKIMWPTGKVGAGGIL